MYDKYRYSCYYWETILLIENCSLTLLLVLLQGEPPALQVLCAMAVIFIEAVLHVSCGLLSSTDGFLQMHALDGGLDAAWVEQCRRDLSVYLPVKLLGCLRAYSGMLCASHLFMPDDDRSAVSRYHHGSAVLHLFLSPAGT
jgi:hypothetical protein